MAIHILIFNPYRTGLPPALVSWAHPGGPPSPTAFALNPDYVVNHPKAMYPELPLGHTNRLLLANTDTVIYPQRRHTPPPSDPIWHETSFIEENWSALANVVIRYYLRNSKDVRDARIRIKDNGQGFWMQVKACRRNTPESKWKWQPIDHTELTPLTPCYQNKDWPWIIIGGKEDVGKYCKALNCPRYLEDAATTDLWFTVALARVEMQDGQRVVLVDEPMQVRRIRQGDLAVVFRTRQERKNDPFIYQGTKNSARKRKRAEEAHEREQEAATTKKRKIGDTDTGDEVAAVLEVEDIVEVADGAVPDPEVLLDGPTKVRRTNKAEMADVVQDVLAEEGRAEEGGTEGGDAVEVTGEAQPSLESIADSNAEGSDMEAQ
jgi:hypothetical protein